MKARIALARPEEVEATLTVTMPLGEWKKLRRQLADHYPSWRLSAAIRDLVDRAEAHFEIEVDDRETAQAEA